MAQTRIKPSMTVATLKTKEREGYYRPKAWSEVYESQEYTALAIDQQAVAARQYFDEVVAPQIPDTDHADAWMQFSKEYPVRSPQATIEEPAPLDMAGLEAPAQPQMEFPDEELIRSMNNGQRAAVLDTIRQTGAASVPEAMVQTVQRMGIDGAEGLDTLSLRTLFDEMTAAASESTSVPGGPEGEPEPSFMQKIVGALTPGMTAEDMQAQAMSGELASMISEGIEWAVTQGAAQILTRGPMMGGPPIPYDALPDEGKAVADVLAHASVGFFNEALMGLPKSAVQAAFGEAAWMDPDTKPEEIASGLGALGGFIVGPSKVVKAAGKGLGALTHLREVGMAVDKMASGYRAKQWALAVAKEARHLSAAITMAHSGDILAQNTLEKASEQALTYAREGAVMGGIFGSGAQLIPMAAGAGPWHEIFKNLHKLNPQQRQQMLRWTARVMLVNTAMDASHGQLIWEAVGDERHLADKVYEYGMNTWFASRGRPAEADVMARRLRAMMKEAGTAKPPPLTPAQKDQVRESVRRGRLPEKGREPPTRELKTAERLRRPPSRMEPVEVDRALLEAEGEWQGDPVNLVGELRRHAGKERDLSFEDAEFMDALEREVEGLPWGEGAAGIKQAVMRRYGLKTWEVFLEKNGIEADIRPEEVPEAGPEPKAVPPGSNLPGPVVEPLWVPKHKAVAGQTVGKVYESRKAAETAQKARYPGAKVIPGVRKGSYVISDPEGLYREGKGETAVSGLSAEEYKAIEADEGKGRAKQERRKEGADRRQEDVGPPEGVQERRQADRRKPREVVGAEQQAEAKKVAEAEEPAEAIRRHPVTDLIEGKDANKRFVDLAIEEAQAYEESAVYVEGDLRNLSGLNAKLGQTGADRVLARVGERMEEVLREELGEDATLVHKGGDEFGITVTGKSKAEVDAALDRVKEEVQGIISDEALVDVEHPKKGRAPGAGVEFASVEYDRGRHRSPEELISEADQMLEKAKKREAGDAEKPKPKDLPTAEMEAEARRIHEEALGEELTDDAWGEILDIFTQQDWIDAAKKKETGDAEKPEKVPEIPTTPRRELPGGAEGAGREGARGAEGERAGEPAEGGGRGRVEPGVGTGAEVDERGPGRGRAGRAETPVSGDRADEVVEKQAPRPPSRPREKPGSSNLDLREYPEIELTKGQRKDMNAKALKILEKPRGEITAEDKEILRQYTGVGGLQAATAETLWQHWTGYRTCRFIWDKLEAMGVKLEGIEALEPSAGVGNFMGNAPEGIRWSAVELAETPASILEILYPDAQVKQMGFEEYRRNSAFDLVISNVPFSSTRGAGRVKDKPEVKELHDYFFLGGIDKVKPNGVIAFITGTGTMDKLTKKNRIAINEGAEFLGAYRLPSTTFRKTAHTSVTTDLIFLRRRAPGEPVVLQPEFIESSKFAQGEKEGNLSRYYQENPNQVLGEIKVGRGAFGSQTGAEGELTDALLKRSLEDGLKYEAWKPPTAEEAGKVDFKAEGEKKAEPEKAAGEVPYREELKLGTVFEDDGTLYRNRMRKNADGDKEYVGEPVEATKPMKEKVLAALDLGERVTAIAAAMGAGEPYEAKQDALLKKIDAYKKKWKKAPSADRALLTVLEGDPRRPRIEAVADKKWNLPDIVTTKTVYSESYEIAEPDPSDPVDVARFSYQRRGELDVPLVAEKMGVEVAEAEKALLDTGEFFRDGAKIERRVDYYAGDVHAKIDRASSLGLTDQVRELERILPRQLPAREVDYSIRLKWVPDDAVIQFTKDRYGVEVFRNDVGDWEVTVDRYRRYNAPIVGNAKFGITADDGLKRYLSSPVKRYPASVYVTPKEAAAKTRELSVFDREFKAWLLREQPELADRLAEKFNRTYRGHVKKDYAAIGEEMTFSGLTEAFKGRPLKIGDHQLEWVSWALDQGKGINAHDVGGGKTMAAILLGRALKDKGRAHKPLYVVPSKVIKKWEREIKDLFPGAVVINLGKLPRGTRQKRLQEVMVSNADFVLITQEGFKEIPLTPEREIAIVERKVAEYAAKIRKIKYYKGDKGKSKTERKIQEMIETLRERIATLNDFDRTDTMFFEELGVDAVIVDEAHAYKNLPVPADVSQLGVGAGKPSQRAMDMEYKMEVVRDGNEGRNVYFLTATPTPNSPLEVYLILKHLAPEAWKSRGITDATEFVEQFGVQEERMMFTPEGTVKAKSYLKAFRNVPELLAIFNRYVDKRTSEELGVKRPQAKVETIMIPRTKEQERTAAELLARAELVRSRQVEPEDDSMLRITQHARQAAISMSIYGPGPMEGYSHPDHKIERVVEKAVERYDTKRVNGQLIFLDWYGQNSLTENLHKRIKRQLVEAGIPEEEIAIVNGEENKTPTQKMKVSDRYNEGKIRIVIGTTPSMGEGMDLQVITTDIHEIDVPWRPDDRVQRWGRGVRQGNENKEVTIWAYLQKGTFDNYSYQLLGKKKTWNDQLWKMHEDTDGAVVENQGGDLGAMGYEELAMELAANPKQGEFFATQKRLRESRANTLGEWRRLLTLEYQAGKLEEEVVAREAKVKEQRAKEKPNRKIIEQHKAALAGIREDLDGDLGIYKKIADAETQVEHWKSTYNRAEVEGLAVEDSYLIQEGGLEAPDKRASAVTGRILAEWKDFRDDVLADGVGGSSKELEARINKFVQPTLEAVKDYREKGEWEGQAKVEADRIKTPEVPEFGEKPTKPPGGEALYSFPGPVVEPIRMAMQFGKDPSKIPLDDAGFVGQSERAVKDVTRWRRAQIAKANATANRWTEKLTDMQLEDLGASVEGIQNLSIPGDTPKKRAERVKNTPGAEAVLRDYKETQERMREAFNEFARGLEGDALIPFVEDYLLHVYADKPKKVKSFARGWVMAKPKVHGRKYDDLAQAAAEAGLTPLTQDISKLHVMWANMYARIAASEAFVRELPRILLEDGTPVVLPAEKAPSDYVDPPDHPIFERIYAKRFVAERGETKEGLPFEKQVVQLWYRKAKVHPDFAPAMKMILDRPFSGDALKTWLRVGAHAKRAALIWSLFHFGNLTESAQFALARTYNPLRGIVTKKEGSRFGLDWTFQEGLRRMKDPDRLEDAIFHGLVVDPVHDAQLTIVHRDLMKLEKRVQKIPVLKQAMKAFRWYNVKFDRALWAKYYTGLKFYTYEAIVEEMMRGLPDGKPVTPEISKALKEEIAKFVNDAYGGQEWESMAWASPKVQQLLVGTWLAPDYTISNLKIASNWGLSMRRETSEAGTEAVRKVRLNPVRTRQAFLYWRNAAANLVIGHAIMQAAVMAAFGDEDQGDKMLNWENEKGKKFDVDVTPIIRKLVNAPGPAGRFLREHHRYREGQRYYTHFGKQAREVWHWINNPWKTGRQKLHPVVQMAGEQIWGSSGDGFDMPWVEQGLKGWETVPERGKALGEKFIPFSFRGNNFFFTSPMSKGMTNWKAGVALERALQEYADPGLFVKAKEVAGMRDPTPEYVEALDTLVEDILDAADRNNLDSEKILSRAITSVRSSYYTDFFKASESGDEDRIRDASLKIVRLHGGIDNLVRSAKARNIELTGELLDLIKSGIYEAAGELGSTHKLTNRKPPKARGLRSFRSLKKMKER